MTQPARVSPFELRVSAIEQLGYTRREAEFVVLAALHSGYFLRRQFAPSGKLDDALCRKLLGNGHGKLVHSAGKSQVFQIHGKPLFRMLGQVDNRHRRRHESFYMRSKLMLLDYVLATGKGPEFLPTEEDKIAYFCHARGLDSRVLPARKYVGRDGAKTTRYFVEKFPVKVDAASGRVSFGFVDDAASRAGFDTWLTQISPLVNALGGAEIVFISPSVKSLSWANKEFARRFGGGSGPLEAYFRMRHALETRVSTRHSQEVLDRYRNWQRQFAGAQYEQQYSVWKQSGESIESGDRRVTLATHLLPFKYRMFGEVGVGEESNVGMRDGSDELEGGCVSFVATADQQFVRIGFSPGLIRKISDLRRLDLGAVQQTGLPVKMLGYMPGSLATERWLHRRFSAEHTAKKWFRASEDLRSFIAGAGLLKTGSSAPGAHRERGFQARQRDEFGGQKHGSDLDPG